MIDEHNPIAKNFRMAAEHFRENPENDVKLCLIGRRSRDGRMYNLPTCSEVAALIVGMILYDIIIYTNVGFLFPFIILLVSLYSTFSN